MAPERVGHVRAKTRARTALEAALLGRGLECEALGDGVAVRVPAHGVRARCPRRCGPPGSRRGCRGFGPGHRRRGDFSVGTRIDSGAKLVAYFQMPSVHHYLMVDLRRRAVVHHRRAGEVAVDSRICREGTIELDPPGVVPEVRRPPAGCAT